MTSIRLYVTLFAKRLAPTLMSRPLLWPGNVERQRNLARSTGVVPQVRLTLTFTYHLQRLKFTNGGTIVN